MRLGEMAVSRGLATAAEIDTALHHQQAEGGRLGSHLIAMGVLTSDQLFSLLREQHEIQVTLPFCETSVSRWEKEFGTDHPSTGRMRCNLARVLLAAGRPADALTQGRAALAAHKTVLGSGHPWTIESARVTTEALNALNHHPAMAPVRAPPPQIAAD